MDPDRYCLGRACADANLGNSEFINYDGYWHLFIATQDRWRQFVTEFRGDAHPPLYLAALRVAAAIGHSRLLLRSPSIVPGAVGVYVLGRIGEKIFRQRTVAWLMAAAYGFAMVMIGIDIDVRSYPLCLMFILLALYCLVTFLNSAKGAAARRQTGKEHVCPLGGALDTTPVLRDFLKSENVPSSLLKFGVFTSAAIATEYYAILFWIASVFVLVLRFLTVWPRYRDGLGKITLCVIGLPLVTSAVLYRVHFRFQPRQYNHVSKFYWTRGTSRTDFVLHGLQSALNYVLPIDISSRIALITFVCLLLIWIALFAIRQRRSSSAMAASMPGLLTVAVFIELALGGLAGRYPFGGFERQQSVVFPLLFLTGFLLFDRVIARIPWAWMRTAVWLLCAGLIGLNFAKQWTHLYRHSEDFFTKEYAVWQRECPRADSVYIDQFSLIVLYTHTHDWRWESSASSASLSRFKSMS